MKQYVVEIKTGAGRWDSWTVLRVFKTKDEAACYARTLGGVWRVREEVTI